jgi:hypothetical protein
MLAPPRRPAQPMGAITSRPGEQGRDDHEGVGEDGQGHPAVPGAPAADKASSPVARLRRTMSQCRPAWLAGAGPSWSKRTKAQSYKRWPWRPCRPTHLPRPGRNLGEQGIGAVGGAAEADQVVAGDRQHVADLAGLQLASQPGAGAVDLVAGHPGGRHPGVRRPAEHGRGQLGFGGRRRRPPGGGRHAGRGAHPGLPARLCAGLRRRGRPQMRALLGRLVAAQPDRGARRPQRGPARLSRPAGAGVPGRPRRRRGRAGPGGSS